MKAEDDYCQLWPGSVEGRVYVKRMCKRSQTPPPPPSQGSVRGKPPLRCCAIPFGAFVRNYGSDATVGALHFRPPPSEKGEHVGVTRTTTIGTLAIPGAIAATLHDRL